MKDSVVSQTLPTISSGCRILHINDKKDGVSPYTMRLCRLAALEKGVEIWNNEWLEPSFTKGIPYNSIINMEIIKQVTPVITFRETRAYI